MVDELEFLEGGNYISFSTLRKNGDWVSTPVWFAPGSQCYYLFSAGDAGKIKRLRNFSDVRLASCTVTGAVIGDWFEGQAEILTSAADQEAALEALRRKYGWQMKFTDTLSRLSGKYRKRAYIRVTLATTPAAAA